MKKAFAMLLSIIMTLSFSPATVFASESASENAETKIIGQYDGPLMKQLIIDSHTSTSQSLSKTTAGNDVRVRSYATYNKKDGVTVYVTLYGVGLKNPKFTDMTGTASVTLNERILSKPFAAISNQTKKISADVNIGSRGNKGDVGSIAVIGIAKGANIVGNAGHFEIAYNITIPE